MLVAILLMAGCEDPETTETSMFEAAEADLREGRYREASLGYRAFLEQYPNSPLAPTAEMRIRSIHRTVSSVMERTDSPRPTYHGSESEQSSTGSDSGTAPD